MLRAFRFLSAAALALGVVAPAAVAQTGPEPGVTVDPSSPAAKEYALPVDKAREDAQGKQSQKTKKKKASSRSSLFGEGVNGDDNNNGGGGSTTTTSPTTTSSTPPPTTTSTAPATTAPSARGSAARSSSKPKSSSKRKAKKSRRSSTRENGRGAATTVRSRDSGRNAVATPADVAKVAADANNPSSGGGLGSSLIFGALGLAVLLIGGATGLVLRRRMRSDS
jgi:hypothetical protein